MTQLGELVMILDLHRQGLSVRSRDYSYGIVSSFASSPLRVAVRIRCSRM